MAKQRIHREWFMQSQYGKCDCGSTKRSRKKDGLDIVVAIWGEYHNGKWRSIQRICEGCFKSVVLPRLNSHLATCGCSFNFEARMGHCLPPWITMNACPKPMSQSEIAAHMSKL
jgi:hypothetical protein